MASTIKKPSALPVSFDQFRKNPIAAVAFCMLLAVGYLYIDLRSGYKEQIEVANAKIEALILDGKAKEAGSDTDGMTGALTRSLRLRRQKVCVP